jgi:hypothetical protein
MKQKQYAPMSVAQMALSIYAVNEGYMDDVPVNKIGAFEAGLHAHLANTQGALMNDIVATGKWNDDVEAAFKRLISEFKTTGSGNPLFVVERACSARRRCSGASSALRQTDTQVETWLAAEKSKPRSRACRTPAR